jgi:hypothetical protein
MKTMLLITLVLGAGVAGDEPEAVTGEQEKPAAAQNAADENPLHAVANEMLRAQLKLKQGDVGKQTQQHEARALEMLDILIDMAQKQQQQQQQ